jgi:hypothetical protein
MTSRRLSVLHARIQMRHLACLYCLLLTTQRCLVVRPLIFLFSVFLSLNASWLLRKQFKLSTKVLSAEKKDGKVIVTTEAAKDGKQETVCGSQIPHLLAGL